MDVLLEECPHSIEFNAFIQHLESGLAVRRAVIDTFGSNARQAALLSTLRFVLPE